MGLDDVYYLDEGLNLSQAYVKIECSDESVEDEMIAITEDMVSGFDSSTKGQKTLVVTYGEEEVEFDYEVWDLLGLTLEAYEYRTSTNGQFSSSTFYSFPAGNTNIYELGKDKTITIKSYIGGQLDSTSHAKFSVEANGDIKVYTIKGSSVAEETLVKGYNSRAQMTFYTVTGKADNTTYTQIHIKYKN